MVYRGVTIRKSRAIWPISTIVTINNSATELVFWVIGSRFRLWLLYASRQPKSRSRCFGATAALRNMHRRWTRPPATAVIHFVKLRHQGVRRPLIWILPSGPFVETSTAERSTGSSRCIQLLSFSAQYGRHRQIRRLFLITLTRRSLDW